MKCPRCGKQMPPGADECPYCGYEISVENLVKQSFPEGEDDDGNGLISSEMAGVIIGIIILAAVIAAYVVLK